MQLSGARIWITGASSGIGEALATRLVQAGGHVAITARRADELERIAAACASARVLIAAADVSDPAAVRGAAARIEAEWGGVDLAVLNAGTYRLVDGQSLNADDFVATFGVNLFGALYAAEAVLPGMLARGSGRLAVTSSLVAMLPLPQAAAYGASKAALTYAFEALRTDLAPRGVGVTVIHPGFVRTRMVRQHRLWMPGMLSASAAADVIVRGIERDQDDIDFPRRLAWPVQIVHRLPRPLYRRLVRLGVRLFGL